MRGQINKHFSVRLIYKSNPIKIINAIIFYVFFSYLMKQMHMVVEYTRCRVKKKSKVTNLKINSRIEGYNGK